MPRSMEIITPLEEEDALLFHGMHAREELSRLSEYHLDLLSESCEIPLDKILGANVTIRLTLLDETIRYFNGYVSRFSQIGKYGRYFRYTATVSPWPWFLTRTADSRIFQEMTVREIVEAVFADHPAADFKFELTETYRKWNYCVQYRETDFNFVSRLLEHEGIYYYFRHTDGHHTMVLTDSTNKHVPVAGYEEIPYIAPQQLVRPEIEHISNWEFSRQVQPGVYVHDDYDFERPSVDLQTMKPLPREYAPSDYEVFDYPGLYTQKPDGEQWAKVRIDEYGTQFESAQAVTNCRGVAVGGLFTLKGHDRPDQNQEHLVLGATYDLEFSEYEAMPRDAGTHYRCSFVAMTTKQQFRPKRTTPKPFVQGPQTAVVVGPAGDQIYTDEFGRVKVQFHWDRRGTRDEHSSCWIRVSHPWAGKGWGSVATPRIGQEVIVDFLEGDPDQPIITGRVYNAECPPPFGFPAGAVISGIKSDTHKGGGYNELSMDDTAGKEKVTIHGQYDMNTTVEHDQTTTVHNCRTDMVDVDDSETIGVNQTLNVGSNRTETVGANESITIGANRTESVGANETITIGGSRTESVGGMQSTSISIAETHTVGAGRMHNVGAAEAISVGGAQMVNVGAVQSVNVGGAQIVKVGAVQSVGVGGAHKLSAATISQTSKGVFTIKASGTATVQAPTIVLKAGGSKIIMNSGGITIKGAKVNVKADGNVSIKGGGSVKIKGSTIGEN